MRFRFHLLGKNKKNKLISIDYTSENVHGKLSFSID